MFPLLTDSQHECLHRIGWADRPGEFSCALAEQILGVAAGDCRIGLSTCRACKQLETPTLAQPNAVVASLVHHQATEVLENPATVPDDFGKALQARRYVLPALSEDTEQCQKHRRIPRSVLPANGRRTARRNGQARLGVVGFNSATGLGYLTRDLVSWLEPDRWLLVNNPHYAALEVPQASCRMDCFESHDRGELGYWLKDLDWVLFAETCYIDGLPQLARELGVRTALIPMWECTTPLADWLRLVDLLICPTRHAYEMFLDWKCRFGFEWNLRYLPWPITADRFRFRVRRKCERFLFVDGTGGSNPWQDGGLQLPYRRKGLDLVYAAAELTPEITWVVCSQQTHLPCQPDNVIVKPPPADNSLLYEDGDVCVQPSRFEGLGLCLLECQAAGLPLITTDAAPMNEYQPLRVIPANSWDWGFIFDGQPIPLPRFDPQSLADLALELFHSDVTNASLAARQFIEQQHSWETAAAELRRFMETA